MKKLLFATAFLVLAALTETPADYTLTGSGEPSQVDAYLSAWQKAEADGIIGADLDACTPLWDVQADESPLDSEGNIAI